MTSSNRSVESRAELYAKALARICYIANNPTEDGSNRLTNIGGIAASAIKQCSDPYPEGKPKEYNSLQAEYEVLLNVLASISSKASYDPQFYAESIISSADYAVSEGWKVLKGLEK